ncbi:cyclic peptide export ABC transporter [Achromobacter xylosoxidans]|uniref:cyclic peptide export ABC transporter n=1 Tax=Alcaligenes xylosoxydans xylosoxydans TaxID=85698 RepID=UPI001F145C22
MLAYLIAQSRALFSAATFTSVISGACGVLLIAQINLALTAEAADRAGHWRVFALVALLSLVANMVSAVLFERLSQRAHAALRGYVSGRVLQADFRGIEQTGAGRIQSALSEHSANVAQFFVSLPAILTNAVVVLGCLVYMAMLSWQVFLYALGAIGLGSLGYHYAHLRAIRHLDLAAREQDQLFGHFRALTDGAKELRLNRDKRAAFADQVLGQAIETVRRERALGMSIFVTASSWGNFLIYAFIGLVLFVLVGDVSDSTRVMTGFALIFVYMVAPLEVLLMNIPRANLAQVSARQIQSILDQLPAAVPATAGGRPDALRELVLRGVTHRYYHEQSDDFFTLGPIDLRFTPGEVVFLVGGNGSGKTTLAKLLVGLYGPEGGEIVVNGEVVEEGARDDYRQYFTAIFSDFHLFDRLMETGRKDLDAEGNRLIARLHLQHKVQVRDGAFTTRALSQGQRKRLALVVAYLEDRPFLVFDEWAADQDPVFKEVFYREVLPELRALGKTVLVISHDDRYFHLADRLLHMENGRLRTQRPAVNAPPDLAPEAAPAVA